MDTSARIGKELEKGLKEQYWQNDTQKNTLTARNQFIRDAPTLELSVYVFKYSAITQALFDNNDISNMQTLSTNP